jgi:signal transduction histidine kinase
MVLPGIAIRREPERSPAEAAQLVRLKVFLTMRWFAIAMVAAATLLASRVFGISFPVTPVYAVTGFMLAYNLLMFFQVRGLAALPSEQVTRRVGIYSISHIALDLISFGVIMHYTGGAENPFIFIIALHIVGASTLLSRRAVFVIAAAAMLLIITIVTAEYFGAAHVNLGGFVPPTLYQEPGYVLALLAALASILFATAFMVTAISGELRRRQQEVVQLRERLIDETTEELARVSGEITKLEEEKNKFLRFLGIAAHDMKAPLAAIQSYFGIMLGGYTGDLNPKQKGMIERSNTRIKELMNLISDLLDIPRIETGQLVQEMKDFSLKELLKRCLAEQRTLAREKGLALKTEAPDTLGWVYGSPPRIQQVLTNLVNNSISYTQQGCITVKVTESNDHVRVDVSDTGIGIPADEAPKIFEDFFRASNTDVKGTGLGLSITRRIVESHNGQITCQSPCPDTDCGCLFTFTLPKTKSRRKRG